MISTHILGAARMYVAPNNTAAPANFSSSNTGSFRLLGTTESGLEVELHTKRQPIYCDELGGPNGTPLDFIYLGSMSYIKGTLVRYDESVLSQLWVGLWGVTRTSLPLPGIRIFDDQMGFTILIECISPSNGTQNTHTFQRCTFSEPRRYQWGNAACKVGFTIESCPYYNVESAATGLLKGFAPYNPNGQRNTPGTGGGYI